MNNTTTRQMELIMSTSLKTFIRHSDCKIARILYRYVFHKRYIPLGITTENINYLTIRNDGTMSFLPAGKEFLTNDDGTWKRDNRQFGKPSKVIRKVFSKRMLSYFKNSDFEQFANEYKAKFVDEGFKFELLDSSKIIDVYCMTRAYGDDGTLGGSCMNGDSDYLQIYNNCDKLRILVLKNSQDELCGRALVWNITRNNGEEIVLMDRIYVAKDFMYEKFLEYCDDNKMWRKEHYNTYDYKKLFVKPDGECIEEVFKVKTNTEFEEYPYIDTFAYGVDGILTNSNCDAKYCYMNTNGTRDGESTVWDSIDERWIDEDYIVEIDGGTMHLGLLTHYRNTVETNGLHYYKEDESLIIIRGCYYDKTDENIIQLWDGQYYFKDESHYCNISNKWYMDYEVTWSKKLDKYIPITLAMKTEDGDVDYKPAFLIS